MEFSDFHDAWTTLLDAARHTLRTELTSVWLPIQFGLIGLSVIIAIGISVAIRRRVDLVSLTMGWPPGSIPATANYALNAARAMNVMPRLVAAKPGLLTVMDFPAPVAADGLAPL